ncbi:hypothetical protein IPH25_04705 [bacterium]|nr:MAG: hypothetical protein IPG37_01700 [bacterium]QQR61740.1 MAG: hypothetical protein IPH25_04705 [bacterium]QQR62689.1 MAG: hypothetical protein IPH67_04715 [bacterium]
MKTIAKLYAIMGLGCLLQKDVYGMGLVSNLLKAGKDSVTDYVRTQKNYYIDGTNVMRLYELEKPVAELAAQLNLLKEDTKNLLNHVNHEDFLPVFKNVDDKTKAGVALLQLIENKAVTIATPLTLFSKPAVYVPAADSAALDALIKQAETEINTHKEKAEKILKTPYAKLYNAITKNTDCFVTAPVKTAVTAKPFKTKYVETLFENEFAKNSLLHNGGAVIKQELIKGDITIENALEKIQNIYNEVLEKTSPDKKAILQKEFAKFEVDACVAVCLIKALDMYLEINDMKSKINEFRTVTVAEWSQICTDYCAYLKQENQFKTNEQLFEQHSVVKYLKSDDCLAQCNLELLNNRSVIAAQALSKALVEERLKARPGKKDFTNPVEVATEVRALMQGVTPIITNLKTALAGFVPMAVVVTFNASNKQFDVHVADLVRLNLPFDQYQLKAQALIDETMRVVEGRNATAISKRYKELTKLYVSVVYYEQLSQALRTFALTSPTSLQNVLQNELDLVQGKDVLLEKYKQFAEASIITTLKLEASDLVLNELRKKREHMLPLLVQRLSLDTESNFNNASAIVTAGDEAYKLYNDMRSELRGSVDKAGAFGHKGTKRTLSQHVRVIVDQYIRNGKFETLQQELQTLEQEFKNGLNTSNLTDQARQIVETTATNYLKLIIPSLKAQVIAAWKTHDLAWKMGATQVGGFGGAALNALRVITPTCGKGTDIQLETIF